jgi:SNF2 family DNA or RNA helicase
MGEGWSRTSKSLHVNDKVREKRERALLIENKRLEELGKRLNYTRDVDDINEVRNIQKQSSHVVNGKMLVSREWMQRGLSIRPASATRKNRPQEKRRPIQLTETLVSSKDLNAQDEKIRKSPEVLVQSGLVHGEFIKTEGTEQTVAHGLFENSSVVLCSTEHASIQRSISVATFLASKLKSHQIEGIRFMWDKVFADLAVATSFEEVRAEKHVGGAILAHFMGLGKTAGMFQVFPCFAVPSCI